MKQHLFIVLLFTGVTPPVLPISRKYYLIQQSKTWSDAHSYCKANHNDLAVIENTDEMVQVQNLIQTEQFTSGAWIGLYREIISWHWSLENEPLGDITQWRSGEPNNEDGIEWCGDITTTGWCNAGCSAKLSFVCFDGTKEDNDRYIFISDKMTWYEAQTYCRNHGMDLASARNGTEHSVILGVIFGSDYTWIGLTKNSFKWTDETIFSTISWMSGQPDNDAQNESCVYLNNVQAANAICSDTMPFYCYSEITGHQQIMSMKVRFNRDVTNLVMEHILDKIMQKLQEARLSENITVKWRLQPEGKVFYNEKKNPINER